MQFQDPSAGAYGGAGGATGAVDEDDDGKQLLVNHLHTICIPFAVCSIAHSCLPDI